ncbi:MAG: type IV pili methyl-accepting chemotaxis transducer N-terminal domain-containing protein [Pseudomonadota bacterium]
MSRATLRRLVLAATVLVTSVPVGALAQSAGPTLTLDRGTAELRIALADRKRLLAERIGKALCFTAIPAKAADAQTQFQDAVRAYAVLHDNLNPQNLNGLTDDEFGRVAAAWGAEDAAWVALVAPLMNGSAAFAGADGWKPMLAKAEDLGTQTAAVYGLMRIGYGPTAGFADVQSQILLDVYGRQRVLADRLAKNACQVAMDPGSRVAAESLQVSIAQFDLILRAMQTGARELGVSPPPSARLSALAGSLATEWNALRPALSQMAESASADPAAVGDMHDALFSLTLLLEAATAMLSEDLRVAG